MRKILVVEDEKDILDFLESGLAKRGFSVLTAHDGKEAIAKVKESKPELVILDIVLPELNGLEVLRRIKENYPSVYVILATAKDAVEDLKEGYSLLADYYVTKPYKIEELLKGIELLFSLQGE